MVSSRSPRGLLWRPTRSRAPHRFGPRSTAHYQLAGRIQLGVSRQPPDRSHLQHPTRCRHAPNRRARSSLIRAATTTESAPRSPPTPSSRYARRPPQQATNRMSVRKSRQHQHQVNRPRAAQTAEKRERSQVSVPCSIEQVQQVAAVAGPFVPAGAVQDARQECPRRPRCN